MIDLTQKKLLSPKPGYVFQHYSGRYTVVVVQVRGSHVVTEVYPSSDINPDPTIIRYSDPNEFEKDYRFMQAPGYEIEYISDDGDYRHWPQGLKGRMNDIIQEEEEFKPGS